MSLRRSHSSLSRGFTLLELMLAVRGTYVTGTGILTSDSGVATPLAVRGEFTARAFSLQLSSHDRIVARYDGALAVNDTMRGVIADVAAITDSLILIRLPGSVSPRLFGPHW